MKNLYFIVLLFFSINSNAQLITVTGNVSDGNGPLPGVNVTVKNSNRGTITDLEGNFSIKAYGNETLLFSYIKVFKYLEY